MKEAVRALKRTIGWEVRRNVDKCGKHDTHLTRHRTSWASGSQSCFSRRAVTIPPSQGSDWLPSIYRETGSPKEGGGHVFTRFRWHWSCTIILYCSTKSDRFLRSFLLYTNIFSWLKSDIHSSSTPTIGFDRHSISFTSQAELHFCSSEGWHGVMM